MESNTDSDERDEAAPSPSGESIPQPMSELRPADPFMLESQPLLEPLPPESPTGIFGVAVLFEAALGLLAAVIGWLIGFSPLATCSLSPKVVGCGVLATLPMFAGLLLIDFVPWGPLVALKRLVDELIVPLFRDMRWWHLAIISATAGFGEELLFRGLIQAGLDKLLAGAIGPTAASLTALAVASVLFGLMHPISKMYAVLCVLIGVYLGTAWLVTGNLAVPIIAHGLYDFVALMYLLRPQPNIPSGT